jgi:hypothetical protein
MLAVLQKSSVRLRDLSAHFLIKNELFADPGMVAHIYNPSYSGGIGRKITVPGKTGQKVRLYLNKIALKTFCL